MFQTDKVYLQESVDTNTYGSISQIWNVTDTVMCDVQDINKELIYKNYGFTDASEYKQVFDLTNSAWICGDQVKYNYEQWLISLVNSNMDKMGASNHTYVILSKVVS